MTGFNITKVLDSLSSKPAIRHTIYLSSTIFFFAIILIPPILGILLKWNLMGQVFEDPNLTSRATSAISASFLIALFVSTVDIVAGLPMAWLIVRGKSRWLSIIDTLADIPFIVPTVTLGYSLLLFWSDPAAGGISSLFGSSLVSPGWLLVLLVHFAFSYPVVVRVIVGALQDYKYAYEEASRTLGAASLTAVRTVTLPILKPSIIASFVLAFARSLSETGATFMVAGTFENGPVLIKKLAGQEGPMVLVSLVLMVLSATIFVAINILGPRLKIPIKRIWPNTERTLSKVGVAKTRNGISTLIFVFIILIPSLFVAFPAVSAITSSTLNDALGGVGVWQGYWQSLGLSYLIGVVVTLLNVIVGLPMAILIARKRMGKVLPAILDILVNVPLIIPSIALGVSMGIFWKNFAVIPEVGLIVFAHLSITYPYFVRAMAAAIERIDIELENASRILGAKPFTVFKTIILPLTKYSLFAGAIMMFARSVDETGATLAVATTLKTAPVLLADWVKHIVLATPLEIGLGCTFLIIFSFVVLLVLRLVVRGRGRY